MSSSLGMPAAAGTNVPQLGIPYVQPGAQVQLQINPGNPQDIALII